jgi:hypothetical protein
MKKLILIFSVAFTIVACSKKTDEIVITPINDYAPLIVGKYITYKADSLIFITAGTIETHRKYEVKYAVTDSFTDNLGRKAFRIVRSARPENSTGGFATENTFFAVNTGTKYEFTENNMRFLKLVQPIKDGETWKGNSGITLPTGNFNGFTNWDYEYKNVGLSSPIKINNVFLPNTITINQADLSVGLPVVPNGPGVSSKDSAVEIYAKGIGMVYKKFIQWEYQAATRYTGYGITLEMIDHN